ncbi:MAG: gamma-glutamylcyclotransferase [Alphaproteobacteria bacterium]|nr:gamma-glutamylcyclotransferase [Alphaproteobacteria bacterium]
MGFWLRLADVGRLGEKAGSARRAAPGCGVIQRAFNKPSVSNWGTKESPCPTLSVVKATKSSCRGVAFEFADHKEQEIRTYLIKREGKGFELRKLAIRLDDGPSADAVVAVYEGENILLKQPRP